MTEDQRGNIVATAVWKWLQQQKAISFVPWVLDPKSDRFDSTKKAIQDERERMLESLEQTILEASKA